MINIINAGLKINVIFPTSIIFILINCPAELLVFRKDLMILLKFKSLNPGLLILLISFSGGKKMYNYFGIGLGTFALIRCA